MKAVKKVQEPRRHHYIPVFYLKRWIGGPDNRLCEFSRPYKEIKAKRKHPSATAYELELYTIKGFPPEHSQMMERFVMGAVDSAAAEAMRFLLTRGDPGNIPLKVKAAWARFVYSLILRTPEHLTWAQQKLREMQPEIVDAERERYLSRRTEEDPATFEEFREKFLADPRNSDPIRHLHRFVGNGTAANYIMSMRWSTGTFINASFPLLTSDRPIVMTNGFAAPDGHIAMAISPAKVFFAANTVEFERHVHSLPQDEIVRTMNKRVVEQAQKFVYGQDDSQMRFVRNHFGKRLQSTPLG